MEIGDKIGVIGKGGEITEYNIIGKDVNDYKNNKKGYLAAEVQKPHTLNFWSYAQFHLLVKKEVIKPVGWD